MRTHLPLFSLCFHFLFLLQVSPTCFYSNREIEGRERGERGGKSYVDTVTITINDFNSKHTEAATLLKERLILLGVKKENILIHSDSICNPEVPQSLSRCI